MSRFDWLSELIARCEDDNVFLRGGSAQELTPAHVLHVDIIDDWGNFAVIAREQSLRWCSIWAVQQTNDKLQLNACFEKEGDYLITRVVLDMKVPILPSHTPIFPAANRPERHMQDMYGVLYSNHPDSRRWMRHQAWPEGTYPLRKDFSYSNKDLLELQNDKTQNDQFPKGDYNYPFFQAQGSAVYEIPVGPIHAGVIEPGHFRFQAVGERILNLEERLGYTHKGIEKIAERRDPNGLARLASRISGDTTVSHCWAACTAMERAAKITVPQRAIYIRALLAERERVANHLGDIGAVCNDVGFAFANMQFSRLRELWQQVHMQIFNHRMLMDTIIPGGVNVDIDSAAVQQLTEQHLSFLQEVSTLMDILDNNVSLEDRLLNTGILSTAMARSLGVVGYMAKASGIDLDMRKDHAYPPYNNFSVESPCYKYGDVASRVRVRAEEIEHSIQLMNELLEKLPEGSLCSEWKQPEAGAEGIGMIESWRGEIISYVQFGESDNDSGTVSRFFSRDPSWLNWPALEQLIHGNIVPDFPVCNKSVNGSYSGHDL